MLLKSKSILAIEILPQRVNIIEGVRSARQPKIINYIQLSDLPQSPEELALKIAEAIKEKGIKTKMAHLAIYHPQIEQRYSQTPNLSKKELQQVVKREVRKAKLKLRGELSKDGKESDKKSSELYFDYQISEETEAQKVKKKGMLLATAPQKLVDEYIHLLEKAELDPQLITSVPLVLANALAYVTPAAKDAKDSKETTAFLYLMPDNGLLTIVSQGIWRFSRQLPLTLSTPNAKKGKAAAGDIKTANSSVDPIDYEQLILELSRSFFYFNQQERGKQVSSLVLGSVREASTDLAKYFTEKLQIPVMLFDPTEKLNLGSIPEPTGGWPQLLNPLSVPLGLLTDSGPQASFNLLPWRVREHRKRLAGSLLISLTVVGYTMAVGAGYMGLHWAKENYRQAVDSQQQSVNQLRPAYEQSQRAEQERRERDYHLSILKHFERTSPLWRGVFYELSRLPPPSLVFSSMEITEGEKRLELKAEGVINARTSMQAQQILKKFLNRLKQAVFFSRPRVLNINISPYESKGKKEDEVIDPDADQSKLNFTLRCNILY